MLCIWNSPLSWGRVLKALVSSKRYRLLIFLVVITKVNGSIMDQGVRKGMMECIYERIQKPAA